ncbi:MAG TPA: hypothetical protein VE978_24280, partial [Chitinophagales bacterium]|nr:hypothetical protein [Chitinophagales bacterium]
RADKGTGISMKMPHSIDFHPAMVNPLDKYRSVDPGATIHFTWTANYPGVLMYHCGTPMVLQHMIYGMIGMVIVEPNDGFPGKADREFAIVESEFYLKKNKDSVYVPDLNAALNMQPAYVTFNGKYQQYVNSPLNAKAGERVRMYVLNAGPNLFSAFHVIGTLFDLVWMDGNPQNVLHGMQTVSLAPSSGAIVEFILPEKGIYTFVDHSFAKATKGAVGQIVAE